MICTPFLVVNLGRTEDEIASEGEGLSESDTFAGAFRRRGVFLKIHALSRQD
jgi:hypothetical protein